MRILHTGDWHLGKNLEGQSRIEEQEQFLDDFVTLVEENDVDVILIAGDVYDTSNPPAKAEKLFYDTLKRVSKSGERLTVVIAGNHDNPERLVAAGPLAMDHGIIMVGTPKTIIQTGTYGQHRVVDSGEGFVEVEVKGERAVILTVPFPSEKRLNEILYGDMDDDYERLESYGDRMQVLFDTLKTHYREDTINLLVSHLFVMGSAEGGSERSIQLGGSYLVNSAVFPKEAQYIALGHVHKPQIVPGTKHKARYSGSPLHYNRNETNFMKQVLLVDVKAGEECTVTEIPLPVYKPIEVWKCDNVDAAIKKCEEEKDRNCWVYLEITTDRFIREDEIKQMKELKKDILGIRPITSEKEEEQDRRTYTERPFDEIFKEFYKKERGVEVTEETLQMLLSIIAGEE